MSTLIPSLRGAIAVPGWTKNELWRRARALPSLDLRFAENKSLVDTRTGSNLVTFTRASTGTYVGADGLIKNAAVNEARFDHDPTTGESLGLLVEEQRTNLLVRSEEFNDSYWTPLSATVTANSTTAPTGLSVADTLTEDTSTSEHRISSSTFAWTGNTQYTFSIYAKSNGRTRLDVLFGTAGNWVNGDLARIANFNLTDGTVSLPSSPGLASIQNVGNGWFRCQITATTVASPASSAVFIRICDSNGSAGYTGNGTSGLFLWGAQLEAGAFPTSYIPTTTSAATRSADVASITGTNFSSWYRQDEGTVFADAFREFAVPSTAFPVIFDARVQPTDVIQSGYLTEALAGQYVVNNTVTQSEMYPTGFANVRRRRLASAYGTNNFAICGNGNTPSVDSLGTPPSNIASVFIGSVLGTTQHLNGHIRRLTYWPARLANSILQSITA